MTDDGAVFGESLRTRNLGWLLRATGVCALLATLLGVVVAPGMRGYASDASVELCEHAAAVFSYALAILASAGVLTGLTELVFSRRAETVSGALVVSGAPLVVVLLVVAIMRARVMRDAPFPWQLAIGTAIVASSVALTAAWCAMSGPHTRALAIAISAFTLAALVRIGAWELARMAGERGSAELGSVSRTAVTVGVALEAIAQAVTAAWIGSRGRLGLACSSLAAILAFVVTWGAASGARADAPVWASALHAALAESPVLPAPYALSAAQSFLTASAILLAGAALALRAQPAALTSAFALALVSRGAFDVPLRGIAIVAAAMWAFCAALDERLLWAALSVSPPLLDSTETPMTHAEIGDHLALVNAILNGTSAVLLVCGRVAIANKRPRVHRRLMLTAFLTSTVFLISYLTRVALTGTHVDPHQGALHVIYLTVLVTHMILAITVVPLVLRALWLAWRLRFEEHKKIARVTFPIWLYVSVTGVVVYVMLYRIPA